MFVIYKNSKTNEAYVTTRKKENKNYFPLSDAWIRSEIDDTCVLVEITDSGKLVLS